MTELFDFRKLLDVSGATAERAPVDMEIVNKALDAISYGGAESDSFFDIWARIDEQIGKAYKTPGGQRRLIELRARFMDEMIVAEATRIENAFTQSAHAGWNAWLMTVAEAITLFRFRFITRLCEEHSFPFGESNRGTVKGIGKAVRCMSQGRWPEAYDQLDNLAKNDVLPDVIRAKLIVTLGEVRKAKPAKELFATAEGLAPDDGRVLSAVGDFLLGEEKDIDKARSYYERAIKIAPNMANGYVGMGEIAENENKLEEAMRWYQKAIASASGDSLGYSKLVKLYGRPEFFKAHETDLQGIVERAIAANPEDEYAMYLDVGYVYEQAERFDKAQKWYKKAVALDETTPGGYLAVAQCYEKQNRNDKAEAAYKKATQVAPECYDAYWGLTRLYEQQQKWEHALKCYKRVPLHRKDWAGIARARVGEMHWRLQNYDEAEKILKRELRADRDNKVAKVVLESLAEDYSSRGAKDAATEVYDEILEILGHSYRGDYHNRLGNLHYSDGENEQAAEEYRRAIAVTPDNAAFHRNLARAYIRLKDYTKAEQELKNAFQRDEDTKTFNSEMALLLNEEGNDYYVQGNYREAVERYTKAIELDPSDDVIHSNLGGAWERLEEPGKRTEALDDAINAYRRAQSLIATKKYAKDLERLQRKKEFVTRHGERAVDWSHVVTRIAVEVASNLIHLSEGNTQGSLSDELSKHITGMRASLENRFGVKIPGIRVRGNETDLPNGTYIIMIMEIPLISGTIALDRRFFPGTQEALSSLGVTGEKATNPLTEDDGFWIKQDDWQRVEAAGLGLWDVMKYAIKHLEAVLQRNLIEFLGHQEIAEISETESPKILEELRAQPDKLTALTTVCRGLLAEGVPITPFGEIYEMFDRLYAGGVSLQSIVESLRSLPVLRSSLPGNDKRYSILPLGPRFEAEIRNAIYQTGSHSVLAMEPERCQDLVAALRHDVPGGRHIALLVDDPELRPFVRRLTELDFPNIPVLSRRELGVDLQVETAEAIKLEEKATRTKPDFRRRKQIDLTGGDDRGMDGAPEPNEIAITAFVNEALAAERSNADDQPIKDMFSRMKKDLFSELGIILPEVGLEIDHTLETNKFRFKLNGCEYPPESGLKRDEFLVNDIVHRLRLLNIEGREAVNPENGKECAIIQGEEALSETCRQAGLTTWGPAGFLVLKLSAKIRKNAAVFQTIDVTNYMLDSLRTAFPELVNAAVNRFSVERICLLLRDLLDEEISIRDLRSILESMLAINGTTDVDMNRYIVFTPYAEHLCPVTEDRGVRSLTIADYSNFVRASLKRYISHKYTRGGTLGVYLLDRDIERRIGDITSHPLTDEEKARFKAAVDGIHKDAARGGRASGSLPPTAQNPVVLATMDIRKAVRKLLIESNFPNLAVVGYEELSPDLNIQTVARISWN